MVGQEQNCPGFLPEGGRAIPRPATPTTTSFHKASSILWEQYRWLRAEGKEGVWAELSVLVPSTSQGNEGGPLVLDCRWLFWPTVPL